MTPLFSSCGKCGHPAIKAAQQCKRAMDLANASQTEQAEILLRQALGGLRRANLPMVQAKILNSLGLVYAQQERRQKAVSCFSLSMRLVERHVGPDNWLYARIAENKNRLAS